MQSHTASVSTLPSHISQSQHGHPISHTQLYHVIASQRNTQFLFMQIHINHTDISGHIPSQPIWTDAYFTHRDISTQFPFHTSQAHSQACAQKCSDPDVALIAAYTQKTQFLMEPCTQSGDSHLVTKSHSTQAVQHAHRHIYPPHSYRHTLTDHDTDTSTYSHLHRVRDMQVTHKYRSHSHIHPPTHKHTLLPGATTHGHTYMSSQTQ